jgi:hypothetical protein
MIEIFSTHGNALKLPLPARGEGVGGWGSSGNCATPKNNASKFWILDARILDYSNIYLAWDSATSAFICVALRFNI